MKIQLLSDSAKMPTKADAGSAGFDLYLPNDMIINPGRQILPLKISMAIDFGYEGNIRPRSGFSAKGIEGSPIYDASNNKPECQPVLKRYDADVLEGTIDSTYRGEIGVILKSNETKPFLLKAGTKIAQIVFEQHFSGELQLVDQLDQTERGTGGFGHSGTF